VNLDSLKKDQLYHGFTTVDLLTFVMTILAAIVITVPIVMKQSSKNSHEQAFKKAEEISNSLFEEVQIQVRSFEQSHEVRSIASVSSRALSWEGVVGTDPWGNPFHYRVLKDIYGRPTHLVVWSVGSNSKQDTTEYQFDSDHGIVKFAGDDVGHIRSL
jgi:competence protein ComGC